MDKEYILFLLQEIKILIKDNIYLLNSDNYSNKYDIIDINNKGIKKNLDLLKGLIRNEK